MHCNPLQILVLGPIVIGILCLFFPDRLKGIPRGAAFSVSLLSLAGSIYIFAVRPAGYQLGGYAVFSADNLSCFISVFAAFFSFLVTLYSMGFIRKSFGNYFGYVLITLGSSFAVAFAANLIVLLMFWGILAAMLYLLVNLQGTERAGASAKKALIMIGGTDALMMFGIVLIWSITGSFAIGTIRLPLNGIASYLAFFSIAIACFAKAGAVPFHSWLPDVAEDGPTPVSAYLPAALDKLLGIYLLARTSIDLFAMSEVTNFVLLAVGAITIVTAVMMALVQHDLKRLLGYHAVSQVGYMVLGIGTGSAIGIAGGLFHMLNNAIYKSCLFMSSGAVETRTGTTDLSKLGGLSKFMPVTFVCSLVAALSISGVPPFNGFISKWMIYQGIIELGPGKGPAWIIWLACAMFGSALTIASFMKLLHAVFLGRPDRKFDDVKEVSLPMLLPMVVLASVCLIFGVGGFILPIPLFIAPSVPGSLVFIGFWKPVAATVLLIAGIAIGIISYGLFMARSLRVVKPFIGGEDQDGLGRVSGADFYNTIKDIKGLGRIYAKEESGGLDIYNMFSKLMQFLTDKFQRLHNGILPTYMVWCLLGMVAMFLILCFR